MLNNIGLPGLVLLVLVGVYIWAAVTQSGKGQIQFENPHNGYLRKAPVGFSWTTLFLGFFPALFRSHWAGALIIFLSTVMTAGLAGFIFPFFYNKWYVNYLIEDGYKVVGADRDIGELSKYLGKKLPLLEPSVAES